MKLILIDSGTTNSRIRLFDSYQNKLLDSEKAQIGVRNTAIEGNNKKLIACLKEGIQLLLNRNQLKVDDINFIAASGMITSNLGIYEVPHINSPSTMEDFVNHSRVVTMEEFLNIPCIFIPGMKHSPEIENGNIVDKINELDVMRGEEVESFGLLKQFDVKRKGIIVLPGSHTKFVVADADYSTLTSCLSTLGGETLFAIQRETILSDSLENNLIETIDKEMLSKGYEASKEHGLTRSFYHIRLLQLFSDLSANERANYYTGSVIAEDLKALSNIATNEEISWVIVGGSNPLRSVFTHLLSKMGEKWRIIEADDKQVELSLIYGAVEIALKRFQLNNK